jgi:hypothetical protein
MDCQISPGIELPQQVTLRESTPMELLTYPSARRLMTLPK